MKNFVWSIVLGVALWGCGDEGQKEPECNPHAQSTCLQGAVFWVDSCGVLEEVAEYCPCGCNAASDDCESCECTCTDVSDCCDGCHLYPQGRVCDDGNPDTIGDLCREGTCAGWDPSAVAEPELPAQPEAPGEVQPVQLVSWNCPDGWMAADHETLLDDQGDPFHWCEPPPLPRLKLTNYTTPLREDEAAGERPICEPAVDGSMPVLGHDSCQPIGDACPAGGFPEIPPDVTGNRFYVSHGASGTGTELDPFGSVTGAVQAAGAGDVLVIGPGTYTETIALDKSLSLWGCGVLDTTIESVDAHAGAQGGTLMVGDGATVEVRNLRLSGTQNGIYVGSGGTASLQGVWIHGASRHGVSTEGGSVDLTNVLVDSTQSDPEGTRGRGIGAYYGASLTMDDCTIEFVKDLGVFVLHPDTRVNLSDSAVRFTQSQGATRDAGLGLLAQDGGQADCSRVLFEGNRDASMAATDPDSAISIQDGMILNTRPEQTLQDAGFGVVALDDGRLTANRLLVAQSRAGGILVIGNATAELSDVIIRDGQGIQATNRGGRGLESNSGSQTTLTRGVVEGNRDMGVACFGEGSLLELVDVVVSDTLYEGADKSGGEGIDVQLGGALSCTRVWVSNNHLDGVYLGDPGTTGQLVDLRVSNTQPQLSDGDWGVGLRVHDGVEVTLTRGLFEGNHTSGLRATVGVSLQMEDVHVKDTAPNDQDPPGTGMGFNIGDNTQASCQRCLVENSHTLGVFAIGPEVTLDLVDLTVTDTHSNQADLTTGRGLEAHSGVQLTIQRGLFKNNRTQGLLLGTVDTHGEISDLTVRDTAGEESTGDAGYGLLLADGASLNLTRALLERNRTVGLAVTTPGTLATVEDLTILDTLSQPIDQELGLGIQVDSGAQLTLVRGKLLDNRMHGLIAVHQDTTVELTDVSFIGTRSQESNGVGGSGLVAGLGAQVNLTRGLFRDNHEVGLATIHFGTHIQLEQVSIENTRPRECALGEEPSCPDVGIGNGFGAYRDSSITFQDIRIKGSALAGMQLASLGQISGQGLSMDTNPIGANIQDAAEGYDFFQAVTGLWMHENGINFDSTELPVPDPLAWME